MKDAPEALGLSSRHSYVIIGPYDSDAGDQVLSKAQKFCGCTGIVREPVVGYQDKGVLGAALGVYIGASGVILKPTSGLLQCFASTVTGVGAGIRQWGDEVVRVPHTRIRSPRNFGVDASGLSFLLH